MIKSKINKCPPSILQSNKKYYYTCLMHPQRRSHSERIITIDDLDNVSEFFYIVGNPRGISIRQKIYYHHHIIMLHGMRFRSEW